MRIECEQCASIARATGSTTFQDIKTLKTAFRKLYGLYVFNIKFHISVFLRISASVGYVEKFRIRQLDYSINYFQHHYTLTTGILF